MNTKVMSLRLPEVTTSKVSPWDKVSWSMEEWDSFWIRTKNATEKEDKVKEKENLLEAALSDMTFVS